MMNMNHNVDDTFETSSENLPLNSDVLHMRVFDKIIAPFDLCQFAPMDESKHPRDSVVRYRNENVLVANTNTKTDPCESIVIGTSDELPSGIVIDKSTEFWDMNDVLLEDICDLPASGADAISVDLINEGINFLNNNIDVVNQLLESETSTFMGFSELLDGDQNIYPEENNLSRQILYDSKRTPELSVVN